MSSFLKSLDEAHSKAGDKHGGAAGSDGRGQPGGGAGNFMFATGIECSTPRVQGRRRDQLEECGHYRHFRRDFELVHELGLRYLRYGLPYYSVHQGAGRYDWSFADEALSALRELNIIPILDLMHFGVPDWIGDYQNPDLPRLFADYAEAVARRYPWVRFYTPVNEIYVTARASAKDGVWNESLKSDRAFVTALKHASAASILATQRIAARRPDAVIVQSESAEYLHEATFEPSVETRLVNQQRFLALDLLYGQAPSAEALLYLRDHGLSRAEYDWFMRGSPPGYQVVGLDYYGRNEKILLPDGSFSPSEDVMGWGHVAREYFERYGKPIMHTETNTFRADQAASWLWKQWINVVRTRQSGLPVLGFTWYSLTDQIDWDSELKEFAGHVCECGLFDLERRPRPVGEAYRALLQEFGQLPLVPRGEMFQLTDQPARLRTQA